MRPPIADIDRVWASVRTEQTPDGSVVVLPCGSALRMNQMIWGPDSFDQNQSRIGTLDISCRS
jgi:hypothetical protein